MGSAREQHHGPGDLAELIVASFTSPAERILLADKDDDVEAIHRERVEIRRLRGRIALFRPLLRRDTADPLGDRLQLLGRSIGSVRDLDVMGDRLRSRGDELGVDVASWTVDVAWRAARARDVLTARRASPRHGELMSELRAFAAAPPIRPRHHLDRDPTEFLEGRLERRVTKVDDWIEELADEPTDDEWHAFRRRMRRTRYAFEGAADALGKPARRAAKRVKALTDVLGDLHDSLITRQWLVEHAPPDRVHQLTAALLEGYELATAAHARDGIRPAIDDARDAMAKVID